MSRKIRAFSFFHTYVFGQKCLVPQSWLNSYAYGLQNLKSDTVGSGRRILYISNTKYVLCCSCKQRRSRRVGDSSTTLDDTTESKSVQTAADRSDEPIKKSHIGLPVTVYRQDEVTPRHDDVVVVGDDKPKHEPRSEAVMVSNVETKTPREKLTLEQLQSRLPDPSHGSRNIRPGLVRPPGSSVPDGLIFYRRCFFCFAKRSSRSLDRSPRNFATWSENGWFFFYKLTSKIRGRGRSPQKFGAKNYENYA